MQQSKSSDACTVQGISAAEPAVEPWLPGRPQAPELIIGAACDVAGRIARPVLRRPVQRQIDAIVTPPRSLPHTVDDSAPMFGPQSMIWRAMADASTAIAGPAAGLMQGMLPGVTAGFLEHTDMGDQIARFARTADYLQLTACGSREQVRKAITRVHAMHRKVQGTLPDGRPYKALDPDLQLWVHTTFYAAVGAAYWRFGNTPVTVADLDTYAVETAVIGEMFGIADPPRSWAAMSDVLHAYSGRLSLDLRAARGIGEFLRDGKYSQPWLRQIWRIVWPATMSVVPPFARELLMQPEPSSLQLIRARALVRALNAVVGEPALFRETRMRHPGLAGF